MTIHPRRSATFFQCVYFPASCSTSNTLWHVANYIKPGNRRQHFPDASQMAKSLRQHNVAFHARAVVHRAVDSSRCRRVPSTDLHRRGCIPTFAMATDALQCHAIIFHHRSCRQQFIKQRHLGTFNLPGYCAPVNAPPRDKQFGANRFSFNTTNQEINPL